MKNTDQVKNALDLLREADAGASAPPFLETRLRAAFREQHAVVKPQPAPWWAAWRAWAGIALAGMAVGAVVYRAAMPGSVQAPPNLPPVAIRKPVTTQPAPPPPAVVAEAPAVVAATPRPKARPAQRPARRVEPLDVTSASVSQRDDFLAIPYAPPMTAQDRGEVIRVRLPRQSLRQFGIPVNPERLLERVPADLLVGEDGIPRGIRFVSVKDQR